MNKLPLDTKIVVLVGGPGAEREVSLVSGQGVFQALKDAGFTHVSEVDVKDANFVLPDDTQLAYNIIHGTFGEDGTLQSILEQRHIPYTGASSKTSEICFDKVQTKEKFIEKGVPTPQSETLDCSEGIVMPTLPLPFVIKPPCEGSSVGVHIVKTVDEILPAMQEAITHGKEVLVEEFIQGKELTIAILNGKVLPVVHISPRSGFYDINNKYPWMNNQGGTDYFCPADLSPEVTQRVQDAALAAYNAVGVEVYGRVDVLLRDSDEMPFVLEINTIPGMTASSLFPKAAQAAGISYPELCEEIALISLQTPRS